MPINWNRRKYSERDFVDAWQTSLSIAEVIRRLNLNPYGSTYGTMRDTAASLGLTKDHMTGQGHLRNKTHSWTPKRSLEEVLVYGKKENGSKLLKNLISAGLKTRICENCLLSEWMGGQIPLELEHVDGDNHNNRIENLKALCPNCHALTPTWRGRNKNKQGQVSQLAEDDDSNSLR